MNRYKGNWTADLFAGQGSYYYNNGDEYAGQWEAGEKSGRGEFKWANANRYEGQFRNGMQHGQGTKYWANGDRYERQWRDNAMNARAHFFMPMATASKALFDKTRYTVKAPTTSTTVIATLARGSEVSAMAPVSTTMPRTIRNKWNSAAVDASLN